MGGIVIAGTHSGCGKTTVTLGILAALSREGRRVQSFKAGPDFIDAGLHGIVAGRPSRNLDLWMCGAEYVARCFHRHAAAADIAVVEGVMGMHDGEHSTARLAALLGLPVILVVDAYGMAESAGAVVSGFAGFTVPSSAFRDKGEKAQIAGVIFNRVASEGHYARLKESVRNVPVLGYLPRDLQFEIPHRHLGLLTAQEEPLGVESIGRLAGAVRQHIDLAMLARIAGQGAESAYQAAREEVRGSGTGRRFALALAWDRAFNFYYEDNLDLLRAAGAEILKFSPLHDAALPDGADGVYLGGGYPELHAAALSQNASMLKSLRTWADAGGPVYAECGGMMYLSRGIHDFDGNFFPLAGLLPFETSMTKKLRLGYREVVLREDCMLGGRGDRLRGHEFHYSVISGQGSGDWGQEYRGRDWKGIYSVKDSLGWQTTQSEGYRYKNTLASYIHLHFGSDPAMAGKMAAFLREKKQHA